MSSTIDDQRSSETIANLQLQLEQSSYENKQIIKSADDRINILRQNYDVI